ncbi:hypothetical protein RB653_003998 [Dictyostelium firmibasis]|uniref:Uncharacterized protein n=1 Tax=Dictyostelium firmibasis TaxID=79012 RepID=A0AAN7U5H2_9MYCE
MKEHTFLQIYRNKYLRLLIFKNIKKINKNLCYERLNYYEVSLDFIIKTKNQTLLTNKLNDFINFKNNLNNNNNRISNKDDIIKYHLDFNYQQFLILLKWEELDIELFKKVCVTFKSRLLGCIEKNGDYLFKLLPHISIDKLKWLLYCDDSFFNIKLTNFDIINLLIHSYENNISNDINLNNNSDNNRDEIRSELFNLLTKETFFKSNNKNINTNNNETYDRICKLINVSIENDDLNLIKLLFSKIPFDLNDSSVHIVFGEMVSLKELADIINLKIFKDNKKMLPLYKLMVETEWQELGLFTNDRPIIPLVFNDPDYADFVFKQLEKNNVKLNESNINSYNTIKSKIIFRYKCIREDSNRFDLYFNKKLMEYDYYKCKIMNDKLNLFDEYLKVYPFKIKILFDIIDLGYERLVTYLITEKWDLVKASTNFENPTLRMNHSSYVSNQNLNYFSILKKCLPTDQSIGHSYLFDLLLPKIKNELLNVTNQSPFSSNSELFLDLLKNLPKPIENRIIYLKMISNFNDQIIYNKNQKFQELIKSSKNHDFIFNEKKIDSISNMLGELSPTIDSLGNYSKKYNEIVKDLSIKLCSKKFFTKKYILSNIYLSGKELSSILEKFFIDSNIKQFLLFISNLSCFEINCSTLLNCFAEKFSSNYNCTKINPFFDLLFGLNEFKDYNFFQLLSNGFGQSNLNEIQFKGMPSTSDKTINSDRLYILFQIAIIPYISDSSSEKLISHFSSIGGLKLSIFTLENCNFIDKLLEGQYFQSLNISELLNHSNPNKTKLWESFGLLPFLNLKDRENHNNSDDSFFPFGF